MLHDAHRHREFRQDLRAVLKRNSHAPTVLTFILSGAPIVVFDTGVSDILCVRRFRLGLFFNAPA